MEMTLTLWLLVGYLCLLPLLGLWGRAQEKEKTLKDYYLAGGMLGTLPLLFTLYATQFSGNTILGFAGSAYRNGPIILFTTFAMSVVVLMYFIYAKPLHALAKTHGFLTIADYFRHRYNSRALVRLANTLLAVTLISYILTNFKAAGLLLESVSGGEISVFWSIIGLAFVMAIYESLGGMRSVVLTDVLQGSLLLMGAVMVVYLAVSYFGGFAPLIAQLQTNPATGWQALDARQWARGISIMLLFGFAICIYPHSVQRIYAAESWGKLKRSLSVLLFAPFFTTLPIVIAALAATLIIPDLPRTQTEQVLPLLLAFFAQADPALEILLALFMVAALAAIMSTIDSALLSLGATISHDVVRPYAPHISQQQLTAISKVMAWVLMFAAAGLAIILPQTIWQLLVLKLEIMAQITPALVIGLRLARVQASSIIAGMLVGLAITIWFKYGIWGVPDLFNIHAGIWGLGANLATITALHLCRSGH
ncbi:MAG: sodium:solute symporter family protein, partial [Alphaproteobacteria bacterium]|nr:sodium:solute symporter family protein [Alphaproteobacteria bacterium]